MVNTNCINNCLEQLFVFVPAEVLPYSCFILYMSLSSCPQLYLISPGVPLVARLSQRECRQTCDE